MSLFMFHKELAPEGRLFPSDEDIPNEPGWVDTPQKFDPNYQEPAKVERDGSLPADAPAGFVAQPYPSHRYRVNQPDTPKTVNTAEEDAALEAAEPGVWKHSPDPNAEEPKPAAAAVPPNPAALDGLPASAPGEPVVLTDAQKAELYAATVTDIVVKVSAIAARPLLEALAEAETANPKGARKTVAKAVAARLAELNAPE